MFFIRLADNISIEHQKEGNASAHLSTKFHNADWFIGIVITGTDAVAPPRIISHEEFVLFGAEGNVVALRSALDENMNYLDVRGQVKT